MLFSCKFPYCTKIFNKYTPKQKKKAEVEYTFPAFNSMSERTMTVNDKYSVIYVVAQSH